MSLENITNKHLENLKNDLEYKGNNIFTNLVENKQLYLNSIPESLFVNYFLPCLLGNANNSNWIMEWISIAGTPASEVGIYDETTKEILYYVPPILNTNQILLSNRENNLSNIFTRYNMYNSNLPVEGERFLNNELVNKEKEIMEHNNKEYLKVWFSILQRYNLIPSSNSVTNNTNSNLDDILDY